MSARDDDLERGEGFLGRWIKRKAQARETPPHEDNDEPKATSSEAQDSPSSSGEKPASKTAESDEPAFDLSKLPSLESITAETNLTDFMRKEVPAALRNAALKRAWAVDPVIRDYLNPAREYAFDWNTPGGVPGNGPLEAGFDALKHVAEAFQSKIPAHTLGVGEGTGEDSSGDPVPAEPPAAVASSVRVSDPPAPQALPQATANTDKSDNDDVSPAKREAAAADLNRRTRRHGGAAPA